MDSVAYIYTIVFSGVSKRSKWLVCFFVWSYDTPCSWVKIYQGGKHDEDDDAEVNSDDNDAGDDDDGDWEDNMITILAICEFVALSWLG